MADEYRANKPEYNSPIAIAGQLWWGADALQKSGKISTAEEKQLQDLAHQAAELMRDDNPQGAIAALGQLWMAADALVKKGVAGAAIFKDLAHGAADQIRAAKGIAADGSGSSVQSKNYTNEGIQEYTPPPTQFNITQKEDFLPFLQDQGKVSEIYINSIMEYDVYRLKNVNHDYHENGRAYIFLSTPNLNIGNKDVDPSTGAPSRKSGTTNRTSDSFFYEMSVNEPNLMNSLTTDGTFDPFIKLLTNLFEEFTPHDTVISTKDHGETFGGYKQVLPTTITGSTIGGQLQISFIERAGLPVTKLHKLWVEYMVNVRRGTMRASADSISKRLIDYMSSLYYFQVAPDGETITYYAKYTGVYPITVPYSAFTTSKGSFDAATLSIPYVFQYKEDMNPDILTDFNIVSAALAKDVELSNIGRPTAQFQAGPSGTTRRMLNPIGDSTGEGIAYPKASKVRVDKFTNNNVGPGESTVRYKLIFY